MLLGTVLGVSQLFCAADNQQRWFPGTERLFTELTQ